MLVNLDYIQYTLLYSNVIKIYENNDSLSCDFNISKI
jgi:hypothetical protein